MTEAASEREKLARIRRNQEDVVSRLRAGDLVKINRNGGFFKHWAVYIGDSLVIHVQVPDEDGAFFRTSMSVSRQRESSPRYEGDTRSPRCGGDTRSPRYGGDTHSPRYGGDTRSPRYGGDNRSPRYIEVRSTYSHGDPNDAVAHIYPTLHVSSPGFPNGPVTARYPNGAISTRGYGLTRTQPADRRSNGSILRKKDSYVLKENIFDVAEDDEIELGNDLDTVKMPLPPDVIVARAESLVDDTIEYHALYKNCEHFARWCRYGEEISVQSRKIVAGLTLGPMLGGFLIGGPVGATVAGILSVGALIKNAWNEKPN